MNERDGGASASAAVPPLVLDYQNVEGMRALVDWARQRGDEYLVRLVQQYRDTRATGALSALRDRIASMSHDDQQDIADILRGGGWVKTCQASGQERRGTSV
ncbi:hypothetical protein [Ferruginivarius sediminum]|uniref:Uncharacterized protein n=1 Tax=Ferruginivarius sediminum TaxID=2661937 RepID=A0A369T856_9PROT|nr:hypothetical protein [Ferruginivarius sediminum]RDD61458.1 hypothetical protein DRB17_13365 [Ferruginivarius sediminum]